MEKKLIIFALILSSSIQLVAQNKSVDTIFSLETNRETKTWTRWWWMGNAVDKPNIKNNLIKLHEAGIGGVEITPIYGVKGEEENFIDFLSPEWIDMLNYTIKTADSLNMGVDMVLGTGWPYGGPQVEIEYAATKLVTEKYEVKSGEKFNSLIKANSKEKQATILLYVLAFGKDGSYKNLTDELEGNSLSWKAKKTNYTIYAVFSGKTGQQVKRSAPGGAGYTLDHYSEEALNDYLKPFNKAFESLDGKLNSIFNDSYEVYGTDFTPDFFDEFEKRRGYDLKPNLELLLSKKNSEEANRVKSDYRETLSDLLLYRFEEPWTAWAHEKGLKTRLQAHGSPGNLIDLYAAADIPECETFGSMPFDIPGFRRLKENIREGDADPVMLKFSSSAAHISGKPLTSSETFTWLRDHFKTALSQTKPEVEELMLNGINHIYVHGNTYSPKRAKWPGWKFYAAVNFSPNNTIWEDASGLFEYINNCQSFLQAGEPDNEILLYWPVHDIWGNYLNGELFFQMKIHSLDEWLHGTPFYNLTKDLMRKGYQLDFISDAFVDQAEVQEGKIVLPGGTYKSLVIPDSDKMPLKTLKKLIDLKEKGASIIFEGLPESVPGFTNYEQRTQSLKNLLTDKLPLLNPVSNIPNELETRGILPETMIKTGLKFIRRDENGEKIYFLVNHTSNSINEFIPVNGQFSSVILFDPLTGKYGKAQSNILENKTMVKVNILPGQSFFLKTGNIQHNEEWGYYQSSEKSHLLEGKWYLTFDKGGPELPKKTTINHLETWTNLSEKAEAFSGTATYTINFKRPEGKADNWLLDLGDVRESARIWVNDEYIGEAWSVPFRLNIGNLKDKQNTLKIKVTNLPANRIRDMEIRGEEWKIFYEINMVNKDYEKFDATKWDPTPSGLLGPITLTPLTKQN
ncbi:glycosyl hydrolase [Gramella sp. AN32]|uniref:Glycosyl hydrolase n=1 Tax=Christiangramia antarctica TaxID=2058158 RepID=A0ABW5X3J0_9FLAO|nr:glycosyl hydrolase [Gramella sp. AN32]MCM4157227.1 glycoside hydrolase [Gramella sp. AN32]